VDEGLFVQDSIKFKKLKSGGEKFSKVFQKSLWFLTYLNYSDGVKGCFDTLCNPYEYYSDKVIREVNIIILEPFGTDVYNPQKTPDKKIQKVGNKMQVKTREWVIKQDLFFREGQLFDPKSIFDSERMLWQDQNFKDVRINAKEVDDVFVDIDVIVRDRWSFRIQSSVEVSRIQIGLGFANLFGVPQILKAYVNLNYNKNNIYGISLSYRYRNIKRSRISLSADYDHDKFSNRAGIGAYRTFDNINMRWAGSADFRFSSRQLGVADILNPNQPTGYLRSLNHNYWVSASLPIKNSRLFSNSHRLILSYSFKRNDFIKKPFTRSNDFAEVYLDNYSSLAGIGFSKWDFYTDQNVYLLGIKEYFPKGLSVAVLAGSTGDEDFANRFYSGLYLNYGIMIKKAGFLNINSTYGGYVFKGNYDQFSWRLRLNYFTDAYKMGKANFRQLFRVQTIMSFNRPTGREINLNSGLGFNELNTPSYRGTHSLLFRLEENFIANFKVLGFNPSVFLFGNFGFVSKYDTRPFAGIESSQMIGFGLRLRNASLGMDLIEISLGYFPTLPKGLNHFRFGADYTNRNIPINTNLFNPNYMNLDL
jgi:hypothetical protein